MTMDKNTIFALLKFLRGSMTQVQMDKTLGLKPRTYHKWETGQKNINILEFDQLLKAKGYDFKKMLEKILQIKPIKDFSKETVNKISKMSINEKEFLTNSKFSNSKWWRLKNEDQDISLFDFLKIIHYHTYKVYLIFEKINFTNYSLEEKTISNPNQIKKFRSYLQKHSYFPEFSAAIYLTDVTKARTYNKKIKTIASKLNIDILLIENLVKNLIKDNILTIQADGNFGFLSFENTLIDQKEINKIIFKYVTQKNIEMLDINQDNIRFNFRVAPVSLETHEKICELQMKVSKDIFDLILKDDPNNRNLIYSFSFSSTAI